MRIEGNIQMPKILEEIVTYHREEKFEDNLNLSYINGIPRKIDLVFLCVFYGIYQSKELPPNVDPEKFNFRDNQIEMGTYRFTVKVDKTANNLRHLLLILWVSKQPPIGDMIKYRKDLYEFLEKILDQAYMVKVIIPFYLKKAAERFNDEPSFISKLKNSLYVKQKISIYSPEQILLEYNAIKKGFEGELNNKLNEWL